MSPSHKDMNTPLMGTQKRKRSFSASPVPGCDDGAYGRGKRVARPTPKALDLQSNGSKKSETAGKSSIRLKLNLPAATANKTKVAAAAHTSSSLCPSVVSLKRKFTVDIENPDKGANSEPKPVSKRKKLSHNTSSQNSNSAQEVGESDSPARNGTSASSNSPAKEAREPKPGPEPASVPRKPCAAEAPVRYLLQYLRTMPLPSEQEEPEKRTGFIIMRNTVIRMLTGDDYSYQSKRLLCRDWWKTQREAPFELEWIVHRDRCDRKTAKATLIREQAAADREARRQRHEAEEQRRFEEEKKRKETEAILRNFEEMRQLRMAAMALQAMLR